MKPPRAPSSLVTQSSLALNSISGAKMFWCQNKEALAGVSSGRSRRSAFPQNLCHNALFCAAFTLVTHFVIMIRGRSLFGHTFVSSEMFSADVIQRNGSSRHWGEIFPAKISLAHHFGSDVCSECYSLLDESERKKKGARNEPD